VFIRIRGKIHYLWRAVDQNGVVLDILVQKHRDTNAAKRFFRKLLSGGTEGFCQVSRQDVSLGTDGGFGRT
jgi:transposase-like protein